MPTKKKTSQPSEQSYLQRLSFSPALLKSWVAKYIANLRLVFLLGLTVVLVGGFSYLNLPKRLNPEVKIPIITVATVLPGASPEDIESLVTIPLENQVRGLKGLDVYTSSSLENVSVVSLQFFSSVSQEKAKADVQSAIDSVTTLPKDAQTPKVTALDFEDQPIWSFSISSNQDVPALMRFSEDLKKQIVNLPKVDRVITSGFEKQEIVITVLPEKMQDLGINPLSLSQSIKQGIASYPAGSVNTAANSFSLTIDPSITSIGDIRNLKVSLPSGKTINLSEVAAVTERSQNNQQKSFLAVAEKPTTRAVTFYVYKTSEANIDEVGKTVEKAVEETLAKTNNRFTLTTLSNTSEEITDQFTDLLHEFRTTIILVFACILLFLGLRQAIISSFTVPLTFLSAFIFMRMFGMSINFLSLFAFLLALGLLVDDTIVVISAMTSYDKVKKFSPLETGLLVWRDTIVPIWSTTITTIWSFVPLLLTSGIIGEFIKPIPVVVTVTMLSSTGIAVLITLPLMIVLLKPKIAGRVKILGKILLFLLSVGALLAFAAGNPLLPLITVSYFVFAFFVWKTQKLLQKRVGTLWHSSAMLSKIGTLVQRYSTHGLINIEPFSRLYHNTILRILAHRRARWQVIAAIFIYAIVSFALLPLGMVKAEFFPKTDQELLYVNLELPAGTNLQQTEQLALPVLESLRSTPQTQFVVAELGKANSGGFSGPSESSNQALFSLHLTPKDDRTITSFKVAEELREKFKSFTDGKLTVVESSGGPPAGADLQLSLIGADLNTLDKYADQVIDFLNKQPEVTNPQKSVKAGTSKIVFSPDLQKVADAGLSVDQIGLWLRLYTSGFTLDSVNFDKTQSEKTDVVFKIGTENQTPMQLSEMTLFTPTGRAVPLLALGRMEAKSNPTVINREDSKRTLTVTASMKPGFSPIEKNKELEKFAGSLNLAEGYSWKTGGVNEENTKSVNSILQAMIVSAILILVTMVLQFNSFRQAIIVLSVIPLAVSSVFLVFALTGTPLSFPALIGVLSLFGIVVTNSMFIVDKINLNQKQGMPFEEAIADAGASRLEPIILTKLCTVFGLLPITLADPLWRGLGGAIISGLLFSSTIMLLFIPTLYYQWFKPKETVTK